MPESLSKASLDVENVEIMAGSEQKKSDSKKKKSSSDTKKKSSSDSKKKKSSSDSKKKSSSDSKKKSSSDSKKKSSSDSKKKSSSDSKKKSSSDSKKKKSSSDSKKKSSSDSKKKSSSDSKKKSSSDSKKKSSNDSKKKSSSDTKKKTSDGTTKKKDAPKKDVAKDKTDAAKGSKDTAKKDAPQKDTAKKDTPPKDAAKKDAPPKDAAKKDTPQKDSPKTAKDSKDNPVKDTPAKDVQDPGPDGREKIIKEFYDKKEKDTVVQHLVFEEPDEEWGSLYVDNPAPLSSHILTVEIPDLHLELSDEDESYEQLLDVVNPKLSKAFHLRELSPAQPIGFSGTPVDYEFRNDDAVTSILLLSFFLMAWVIAASWKFVRSQLRNFFITRERPNLFAEPDDNVLRGRSFLVVQTSFLLSLMFFTSTRDVLPDVFKQLSPRIILLTGTVISLVYYTLKIAIYNLVNHTFFSPAKCVMWNNIYFVSILLTGCSLLPLVLGVVFFDIPFASITFPCILLLTVIKTLLFYKCFRIFFSSLLGCVHLILYFCALEIIPLGIFAFSIASTTTNMLQFSIFW